MNVDEFDRALLWHYRAYLLRVIDGDTFVAMVDTGFFGRHEVHIRLADVDAPEINDEGGFDARDALENALEPDGVPQPLWSLRIVTQQRETIVSEVRSFERYVATVYVVEANDLVNVRTLL